MTDVNRRSFLGTSAAAGSLVAGLSNIAVRGEDAPNKRVTVGVMGLSRGRSLAVGFGRLPGVRVKYVSDVDRERAESCAKLLVGEKLSAPEPVTDFRKILDDSEVDALICAAPNHWHAPATILGCAAGKHVYVEKPCSHNPQEGEWMLKAARDNNRAVQVGTQRRSGPGTIEAMSKLHGGAIGRVYMSRAFYNSARGSIGRGKRADIPSRLDYDLWQGPAPRVPYIDNLVHYNWHWRWHWGNGELGNNGVHTLDLCRWGLAVDFPIRVTSSGGRYRFDDDQETPDTHTVAYEFPGKKSISWHGLSCNRHADGFVMFYGETGTMALDGNGGYRIYDARDKLVEDKPSSSRGDREHMLNFLAAIRNDEPQNLTAEIAEGHKSTLLCHLGNIAQRTDSTLTCRESDGHILNNEKAAKLWKRDYESGWEPKV